jgi:hypothetical protein
MKLNCKKLTITILCGSALGLFAQADLGTALQAEASRFKADSDSWKSRCQNVDKNSAEGKKCTEEGARLQTRLKSLDTLKADAEKFKADADSWKSHCLNVDKNSAEGKKCAEEAARLQATYKSLEARTKPATGQ